MIKFTLTEDYIELIRLLKITRIAESGGMAKILVENGEVKRNGQIEQRKRAKIRKGEIIEVLGETIQILFILHVFSLFQKRSCDFPKKFQSKSISLRLFVRGWLAENPLQYTNPPLRENYIPRN